MWGTHWHPEENLHSVKLELQLWHPGRRSLRSHQGPLGLPGHAKDTLPQAVASNWNSGMFWNFKIALK